ncbi:F-box/LRR-repeat protein At3g26922 [Aegilops tauschii subsp. strangulata]|nr:putative F-box/FBD/LRR-repeat protein At5g56810 [Aegilops tauschii subsp. strangulata]
MASGEDRISALPEGILLHVLRLLPAEEVVRTSFLARRWRGVWRSVPTLLFTEAKGWGSADRFAQFVGHLLHLRCGGDGPPLDSCDFDFDSDGFMLLPANQRRASNWLWKALPRVRALRLRLRIPEDPGASPLSDMHLFSQHLTRLELVGVGFYDTVVDFTGCPALVELSMDTCDVFVKQLLSPSLKHLRITRCYAHDNYRILISLPNLVSLELIEWGQGRIPLLGSLPSLARAVVVLKESCADQCSQGRFDSCGADDDMCDSCYYYYGDPERGPQYDCNNCIFLKGLSEARDLELSANSDVVVFNRDLKWCPTFTKLKTLLLNDWCLAADHNALICFLQHSPILEKLTLQLSKGPPYVTEAEGIYKPLGQSVASNCLKIVEIKCENVDNKVHKILKILATYGIHLEQISVQQTSGIPGSGCFNFVCTGFSEN